MQKIQKEEFKTICKLTAISFTMVYFSYDKIQPCKVHSSMTFANYVYPCKYYHIQALEHFQPPPPQISSCPFPVYFTDPSSTYPDARQVTLLFSHYGLVLPFLECHMIEIK